MSEESTRIVVLAVAKWTFSFAVSCAHSSGDTARIVKYAANSAAKNISSDANQTTTPTASGDAVRSPWATATPVVAVIGSGLAR